MILVKVIRESGYCKNGIKKYCDVSVNVMYIPLGTVMMV